MVERLLYDFDPQLLGVRKEGAREFSEVLEFWALLVNGRRIRCGVLRQALDALAQDRLSFNYDMIEFRALDSVRYAAAWRSRSTTRGRTRRPVTVCSTKTSNTWKCRRFFRRRGARPEVAQGSARLPGELGGRAVSQVDASPAP